MRLVEITKKEFINKLRDPLRSKTNENMNKLRATLKGSGYKISKVEYIRHKEWDIIKFVVFFPEDDRDPMEVQVHDSTRLQKLVFGHFVGLVIPEMSDAIFLRDPVRVSFIYFLR